MVTIWSLFGYFNILRSETKLQCLFYSQFLLQFFAEAGFPCPRKRNPSDHFLRCINSDFDIVTATLKGSQRIHVCFGY